MPYSVETNHIGESEGKSRRKSEDIQCDYSVFLFSKHRALKSFYIVHIC